MEFKRFTMIILQFVVHLGIGVSAMSVPQYGNALPYRASMVFKNPGEGLTQTKYSDPKYLRSLGQNIVVKSDGRPPNTAITWDSFDTSIFPEGSAGRQWVEDNAAVIDQNIKDIHQAGMTALYWTDFFVLPKTLVAKYGSEIVNSNGQWSLDSPTLANMTTYILDSIFKRFPTLDGLVIRTGEVYVQDTPYHLGQNPITNTYHSHIQLLTILEDVVIKKYKKKVFYRTWSFDGFTSDPAYYLNVTNAFEPNPNLVFVIKHDNADFLRTTAFNPTLGIGKHQFIAEVECQREYEAKGATPNYIANGVIDGFEELANTTGPKGLKDLVSNSLFKGTYLWTRGGGWLGPYPANEFWIDMNVKVMSRWSLNPRVSELACFFQYAAGVGIYGSAQQVLRKIALLSAHGVLLGHYSLLQKLQNLLWTRDWYIGGGDSQLTKDFTTFVNNGQVDAALQEKEEARQTWSEIASLAPHLNIRDAWLKGFIQFSIEYGELLYGLIRTSWTVSLKGMAGNATGNYDVTAIQGAIREYDQTLAKYYDLRNKNSTGQISSLYTPFQFGSTNGPSPVLGSNHSVDTWRWLL